MSLCFSDIYIEREQMSLYMSYIYIERMQAFVQSYVCV